jgi:pimeloyl-ACP methyl ester carboxylesterase
VSGGEPTPLPDHRSGLLAHLETGWWGPPPDRAPTLVLLHEGLGSVGLWRSFPAALQAATGCGVFAYSRFGYGRSASISLPRPLSYMHDEARAVLGGVLDAAAIRRCVLVGHSDGGSIAAIYAGEHDDPRVAGLALIAAHFFVEEICVTSIAEITQEYETGRLRERLARHHDDVEAAFRGWSGAWLDPGFRTWNITRQVAGIRVPLLLLQGEDDPYGTVEQVRVAARHARCPVETKLIPGAKHSPHVEVPEATCAAVAAFARRVLDVRTGTALPLAGKLRGAGAGHRKASR